MDRIVDRQVNVNNNIHYFCFYLIHFLSEIYSFGKLYSKMQSLGFQKMRQIYIHVMSPEIPNTQNLQTSLADKDLIKRWTT